MHGYEWNDGGINNQKLALLGLVIAGYEASESVYLPKIYSKDQRDERSSLHDFREIFDEPLFDAFLRRWGIVRVEAPRKDYADRIERGGWRYFDIGAWHLSPAAERQSGEIVSDFFRSLLPLVTRSPHFLKVCTAAFTTLRLSVVTQLRIEEDWRIHCQYNLDPVLKQPEDYNLTADKIIERTRDTLAVSAVFVSCDERYIHMKKEDLTRDILDKTGVKVHWKSDFLDEATVNEMSPVDASLIDFEITKIARTFVGMSRSTFANLATFERFCRRHQDYREDFIYNLPSKRLGLRVDMGRSVDPFDVCGLRQS